MIYGGNLSNMQLVPVHIRYVVRSLKIFIVGGGGGRRSSG